MNKKQWVKIAFFSVPIVALVVGNLAGLSAEQTNDVNDWLIQGVGIVAGVLGVTGVVMNNDKDEQ